MRQTVISIGCICMIILFSCGCIDPSDHNTNGNHGTSDSELIVGTWNTSDPIPWYIKPEFTFFQNKSFDVQGYGGNYTLNQGTLTLIWDDQGKIFYYDYEFIDENTLSLTFVDTGDTGLYERK